MAGIGIAAIIQPHVDISRKVAIDAQDDEEDHSHLTLIQDAVYPAPIPPCLRFAGCGSLAVFKEVLRRIIVNKNNTHNSKVLLISSCSSPLKLLSSLNIPAGDDKIAPISLIDTNTVDSNTSLPNFVIQRVYGSIDQLENFTSTIFSTVAELLHPENNMEFRVTVVFEDISILIALHSASRITHVLHSLKHTRGVTVVAHSNSITNSLCTKSEFQLLLSTANVVITTSHTEFTRLANNPDIQDESTKTQSILATTGQINIFVNIRWLRSDGRHSLRSEQWQRGADGSLTSANASKLSSSDTLELHLSRLMKGTSDRDRDRQSKNESQPEPRVDFNTTFNINLTESQRTQRSAVVNPYQIEALQNARTNGSNVVLGDRGFQIENFDDEEYYSDEDDPDDDLDI